MAALARLRRPLKVSSSKKNVLITSALPYVNNVPHLGNLIGSVLSADAYSRYCRLRGHNSLFICGTDEFGTATEHAAARAGLSPKELCDKYFVKHKAIYDWFDIDFDTFGRTSAPFHKLIAQDIFLALHRNGHLTENQVEQTYCKVCETFLADRYVTGKCPSCGSLNARGDQCEDCSSLLDAKDLIDPACSVCRSSPVIRPSKLQGYCDPGINGSQARRRGKGAQPVKHFYFNLKEFEAKLLEISEESQWSPNAKSITKAWLDEGLKPRCISRDLKWGTPVPVEGYSNKVLYVWFDAPIGYISITAGHTPFWNDWWLNKDVDLVQFMGKDNVPFHTVLFPATLMGSGLWSRSPQISTTEYLNFEGGKFSKSRSVGIFGDDAMESGVPSEVWRYYLFSSRPESGDTNFTWKEFADRTNSELLGTLGNLCNRVLKFIEKTGNRVPAPGEYTTYDLAHLNGALASVREYNAKFERQQLKAALKITMDLAGSSNKYFQEQQPWAAAASRAHTVMYVLLSILKVLGVMSEPFMPGFSAKLYKQLNTTRNESYLEELLSFKDYRGLLSSFSEGQELGKASPIVSKITEEQLSLLASKYKGR